MLDEHKTVWDINQEQKLKYCTNLNTFDMFPIETKVQVITVCQDHNFFTGTEKGKVIRNSGEYLGIIIKFDEPIQYKDGSIRTEFNFNPTDLIVLEKAPEEEEPIGDDPNEALDPATDFPKTEEENWKDFQSDLEQIINIHSMENGSNTPDWILAEYLVNCLKTFNETSRAREKWYGKELKI